tara:strand:- start:54124 stop:54255 length:132 start_codon:yes stop_codon:yes gene_type:complete
MLHLIIVLVIIAIVALLHYLLFTKMAEQAIDKKKSASTIELDD